MDAVLADLRPQHRAGGEGESVNLEKETECPAQSLPFLLTSTLFLCPDGNQSPLCRKHTQFHLRLHPSNMV